MARTFQRLELFGALTVEENIRVAASIASRLDRSSGSTAHTAQELASRVGLDGLLGVRADALPTGQGRLVELARALAIRPRLLLLDEPASGQDESETAHFARVLRDIAAEGIGILLVEHDMQLVMSVCAFIHVLDFGRLLAAATPDEVRADPLVLAAYLGEEWQPA
jgi:branched-chain amino acid transport system ATP-binding protein